MFVIRHRNFFFALSALLVIISLALVGVWGIRPSIDFTGGSLALVSYEGDVPTAAEVARQLDGVGFSGVSVRESEADSLFVRTQPIAEGDANRLLEALAGDGHRVSLERLSSVGPTVGAELRQKTVLAIFLVVLMIILYVAFAFRKVSHPVSSWVYGLVAVLTLLHDIIIPTGVFAVLGRTVGLEADTLFVVALLTILGLSVNDTIVVFDRIRENLRANEARSVTEPFDVTVGKSLEQTYVRSFNTSLTIIIVLLALFFLGGPSIHSFILTLLVGLIAGTYSSIFLASPLLVTIANRKSAR